MSTWLSPISTASSTWRAPSPTIWFPSPGPASLRTGLDGVIDALLSAQHVLEMFRRALPAGASRTSLARHSNRLAKILAKTRKLTTP